MRIVAFDADEHLHTVHELVNRHVSAVVPGWGLPAPVLLRSLERSDHQPIIGPWVTERQTLCAVDKGRVLAAAHLLRYGDGESVGDWYKNTGDIAWFACWPDELAGGRALLDAAREHMAAWGVQTVTAWDSTLPLPLVGGIPDCWPHMLNLLHEAGFERHHPRQEAIFGGWIPSVSPSARPPVPGVTVRRVMQTPYGVAFTAFLQEQPIGWCQVISDLTEGGELPALRGWAELSEMHVDEAWRSRGLGAWLVQHAVEWLRLAGGDRIAMSVDADDEARGAGRFYGRFGWTALCRMDIGWAAGFSPPQ